MHTRKFYPSTLISMVIACVMLATAACTGLAPDNADAPAASDTDSADGAGELTPVSLGVGFIPNVQFAPFYVGIAKGFYADEGLDMSLDYGFENDYLALVGTDELQFMIGSGDQVVLGRAQGLPVRYVMTWYTQYPVVIFARPEAGITEPADLAGKTVGIPGPFGATYVAYRAILEAGGLSETDVNLESIGFTQAAAISEYMVDAAVDYSVNGPTLLAQEGITTTQIRPDTYLRIPANGLVTNERTINENPELVEKMVRATLRAIEYTLENPDEAFEIALQQVPEAGGENLESSRAVFDASLAFWAPREGQVAGTSQAEEWQTVAELMQRIDLVDTLVPAEELYTNEFVQP